jgi:signal transduction histidine kinase
VTLRETSERAQAAEELASIATLVAGLAHEIGTPMGVIQGHAKMLERHVGDENGEGVFVRSSPTNGFLYLHREPDSWTRQISVLQIGDFIP